ncbi:hypothetical protein [Halorubrum tebenquichense]|uniref:Uncharacterized protein n=1 Tax=Halorubrum tebenquichense DSM 14210 TaxID=1227485 RepID=M0E0T4_9EURY|nr:hypothetical protein [Halorubrum tebenquichense]ELZ40537.1 hypothetical protein C472_01709 [Halorubrum tebenquichense DSM 14210]
MTDTDDGPSAAGGSDAEGTDAEGSDTEGTDAEGSDADGDGPEDALAAAGVDPVVPDGVDGGEFADDEAVRAFLREVAEDVRGDSSESKQLSAVLYRVSDLYDEAEETSPEEIYLNVRHIMRIKAEGGLRR